MALALAATDIRLEPPGGPRLAVVRPPMPPHHRLKTAQDTNESGDRLLMTLGADRQVHIQLRGPDLALAGEAFAAVYTTSSGLHVGVADVPVVGSDLRTGRPTDGLIAVTFSLPDRRAPHSHSVKASAVAEGSWPHGPQRFSRIVAYDIVGQAIWLSTESPNGE